MSPRCRRGGNPVDHGGDQRGLASSVRRCDPSPLRRAGAPSRTVRRRPNRAPSDGASRVAAWAAGVQGQIAKLARLAGRSATQSLLIRQPRGPRYEYERLVGRPHRGLCEDTESRVEPPERPEPPLSTCPSARPSSGSGHWRIACAATRRVGSPSSRDDAPSCSTGCGTSWPMSYRCSCRSALGGNPQVARRSGAKPTSHDDGGDLRSARR